MPVGALPRAGERSSPKAPIDDGRPAEAAPPADSRMATPTWGIGAATPRVAKALEPVTKLFGENFWPNPAPTPIDRPPLAPIDRPPLTPIDRPPLTPIDTPPLANATGGPSGAEGSKVRLAFAGKRMLSSPLVEAIDRAASGFPPWLAT